MKNTILVINGKPRSGKDTISKYIADYCEENNIYCDVWSTIDIEKEILEEYVKNYEPDNEIDRYFLCNFKQLLNECYNYTFEKFKIITNLNKGITIVHSREWNEIQQFKQYCENNDINFITLFVYGRDEQEFDNISDKYCNDFSNKYDYKIHNFKDLKELKEDVKQFCESRLF